MGKGRGSARERELGRLIERWRDGERKRGRKRKSKAEREGGKEMV